MESAEAKYPHLLPEVSKVAEMSDDERLSYIDSDRWLPYQRANDVLDKFEDLLKRPRVSRPPNIMLVGRSGNGKSHILDRFSELHPGIPNLNGPHILAPVMLLEVPPTANANDLYDTILHMLNRPRPTNKSPHSRRDAVKDILRQVETKVLMLDEINHLLSGNVNRQREFFFALKHLSNELRISIVIAGTPESLQLLSLSDQIQNRFKAEPLNIWKFGVEMRTLLANFEEVLPLRKPSSLKSREIAQKIDSFGIETIGGISALLNDAAKFAIQNHSECIDLKIIELCAQDNAHQKKLNRKNL